MDTTLSRRPPAVLPREREPRRIPALDGMRGLAVLSVIVFHGFQVARTGRVINSGWDRLADRLAGTGWWGVEMFFVLSGFLITGILHRARARDGYFREFYFRRTLRIFPLYYAVLLLCFVLLPPLISSAWGLGTVLRDELWSWAYLSNWATALRGWGYPLPYLNHFWSLAIEEQFYLMWPVVVLCLSRARLMRLCAAMVVCSLALRLGLHAAGEATAAYVLTPARMDGLAIGAWLALARAGGGAEIPLRPWARRVVPLAGALLAALFLWRAGLDAYDPVTGTFGITLLSLFFGGLVALAVDAPRGRTARFFMAAPLRELGKYSYALYVFHWPVMLALGRSGLLARSFPVPPNASVAAYQVAFTTVAGMASLLLAMISWRVLEMPCLALKERGPDALRARWKARPVRPVLPRPYVRG